MEKLLENFISPQIERRKQRQPSFDEQPMESDQNIKHQARSHALPKSLQEDGQMTIPYLNRKDSLFSGCAMVHMTLGCDMEAMVAIEMVVVWRYNPGYVFQTFF